MKCKEFIFAIVIQKKNQQHSMADTFEAFQCVYKGRRKKKGLFYVNHNFWSSPSSSLSLFVIMKNICIKKNIIIILSFLPSNQTISLHQYVQ